MNIDSQTRIVIPGSALPVERHAAEELAKYLCAMAGVHPKITEAPGPMTNIRIGSAAPVPADDLGYDGYIVRTVGKDLLLTGAKPYSCLYAVYHLLERHLGCGFFEDGDQVPRVRTIELPTIDDVEKPRFEWRLIVLFHTPWYSGMQWYTTEEWKQWFDWAIKKRFNFCELNSFGVWSGIGAVAAGKLGVDIELTEWQKHLIKVFRPAMDHARMCGMRFVHEVSQHFPQTLGEPGSCMWMDGPQILEFVRRYKETTGVEIPLFTYKWWGPVWHCMDPRHPATKKFVSACVEAAAELWGTDHWYNLNMVGEGDWASDDQEENGRIVYAMLMDLIAAVKVGDPQAVIYTRGANPYSKTFAAANKAVQDAALPIVADFWLNVPARVPDFQLKDYYGGLPWSTGMVYGCGKHTNPWGDMDTALRHAHALMADERAWNCKGFLMGGEYNHRQYLLTEFFADLAWDPTTVEKEKYLRSWAMQRYGPEAGPILADAARGIAETLHSCENMDMTNRPMYRDWMGGYLPGLTSRSVKTTLSFLPRLREVLKLLLSQDERLKDSPLYRFDLVDYGRTYLGAIFNYHLCMARKTFRAKDRAHFEKHCAKVEEVMHFIARLCSAHELFRLKTHDDRARRHPPIVPGYDNSLTNWCVWTVCVSAKLRELLDYCAEDFAELIEHYFRPRVKLYLDEMRKLLDAGKDISGKLTLRNCENPMLFVISDWATPKGVLPWSPFGATCEPELTGNDIKLANEIIDRGTVSGRFDFYTGPMKPLVEELLGRFPIPDDLAQIVAEPETELQTRREEVLKCKPGEVIQGFHPAGMLEQVVVPKELEYYVRVEKQSESYNLARGGVAQYKVDVSDWLNLMRRPDEKSERGSHSVTVFSFDALARKWIIRYDPGSDQTFASLVIKHE